jgi:hypothetical protein
MNSDVHSFRAIRFNWSLSVREPRGLGASVLLRTSFGSRYFIFSFPPPPQLPQRFHHRPASGISSGLSLSLPLVLFVVPFFHSVGHRPLVIIVVTFLLFSQSFRCVARAPSRALRCLAAPLPAQALSQAL